MICGSLWAAAWFVLLIACANLANLTLVRTLGRWRDFATRIALGAGQGRMMRQIVHGEPDADGRRRRARLVDHQLERAHVGGGHRVALPGPRLHGGCRHARLSGGDLRCSRRSCCALAPIGRVWQLGVNGALKGDARGVTQGLRGKHLAAGLVAGQMALAIVLLSGAGVLVRSLVNDCQRRNRRPRSRTRPGGIDEIAIRQVPDSGDTAWRISTGSKRQLKTIPGIERGVRGQQHSREWRTASRTFEIEGRPSPPDGDEPVQFLSAGSDYFRVVGAAAISGRDFNDGDRASALPVAIVNQSFAARFWPGEQPLGKRLRTSIETQPGEWRTVVGVVPNIMQGRRPAAAVQASGLRPVPAGTGGGARVRFLLRTARASGPGGTQPFEPRCRKLDPDVILENFDTLKANFAFDRDRMDRRA